MLSGLRHALIGLCAMAVAVCAPAQTGAEQTAAEQGTFTLQAHARVVLTDVTVTDRKGNPAQGLSRAAFHIFDNGHVQQLQSFEEHRGGEPSNFAANDEPGVFSNAVILHPPPVFNVIVLDTTTIGIVDQMYLYQELQKFVRTLPEGEPLAIYSRGAERTVLLQNFTADHNLLLAAIAKSIPRLHQPGSEYASDLDTLRQIAVYLGQYPGRKNVLWYSGGSNLFLRSDPSNYPNMQPIYDELEAARIAIYPVDARGLMVNTAAGMADQQMLMQQVAEATGGRAFFNNNGMAWIAQRVLATDSSYYTLTYAPHDVRFDNRWHKVKVQLDTSGYVLSYRRGYFDDGANVVEPPSSGDRKLLLVGGETMHAPEPHSEPIVFRVRLTPAATTGEASRGKQPKRSEFAYSLHYTVPAAALSFHNAEGHEEAVLGAAVLAMSISGHMTGRLMQKMTLSVEPEKLKSMPEGTLGFDQEIQLPKGQNFLYVAVWDTATGRLGTVQVPLDVTKPTGKHREQTGSAGGS